MRNQHLVPIMFGFVGGPLAYLSAEKLGAVVILSNISYVPLALGWAIMTPTLLFISKRFDGFEQSASTPQFKASHFD
jgi:mannitol-specific phosphotransferase system IIBC component